MRVRFWARTDAGRRPENQDAVAFTNFGVGTDGEPLECHGDTNSGVCLALLADGVGGSADGRWAARTALEHLLAMRLADASEAAVAAAISDAAARLSLQSRGPGSAATTLAGVALNGEVATIFNVGDSRVYSLAPGRLRQLTVDHRSRTNSRAISRFLGGSLAHATPNITTARLISGSWFLLLSDGVYSFMSPSDFAAIDISDPQQACSSLVRSALAGGSEDNLTAALVAVG